ncbi:MAG: SMC-Scp complex subunit ScpB, partial [Caldilinea sp.]
MSGPADLSSSAEKAALFCPPPLPPRLETQTEDAPTAARTAQTRRPPPPSAVAAPQKPEHSGPLLRAEAAAGGALGAEGQDALSLQSALESLLFVADAPVEAAQLARAVHTAVEQVEAALHGLEAGYQAAGRGLRLA